MCQNVFSAPSAYQSEHFGFPTEVLPNNDADIVEEVVKTIQCTNATIKKCIAGTEHEGSYDECQAVLGKAAVDARKCGELDIVEGTMYDYF